MTHEHFSELMQNIGFEKLRERWKDGGKMAYWLLRKRRSGQDGASDYGTANRFEKKVVLREGKRNNFCILL